MTRMCAIATVSTSTGSKLEQCWSVLKISTKSKRCDDCMRWNVLRSAAREKWLRMRCFYAPQRYKSVIYYCFEFSLVLITETVLGSR